jgi:hypothetical protein
MMPPTTPLHVQALLYGVTLTSYDMGIPAGPLPRENPPTIIPFCLTLFNFGVLDDFANFVDESSDDVFDPQGTALTTAQLTAPPVIGSATNVFSNGTVSPPFDQNFNSLSSIGGARSQTAGGGSSRSGRAASDHVAADVKEQAGAMGLTSSSIFRDGSGTKPALAPRGSGALEGAYDNSKSGNSPRTAQFKSFSDSVNRVLDNSPQAIKDFANTPFGQQMMARITNGSLAEFVNGANKVLMNATDETLARFSEPLQKLSRAASNFTGGVVHNATNLGLKAAVATLDSAEPIIKLGARLNQNIYQPMAQASKALAAQLQEESQQMLLEDIAQLPDGKDKQQLLQTVQKVNSQKQLLDPGMDVGSAEVGHKRRIML